MALVPGIIALLIQTSRSKSQKDKLRVKILSYLILFLELLVLYFTYSYGAWLGLAAALFFVILSESRGRAEGSVVPSVGSGPIKRIVRCALIALTIFALIFITQLSNPKLQHILNGDYYSSLHSRLMIWQSAWLISKDHWLAGVGAGNFQQAYLDYQSRFSEPYIEWAVPMPHNIFLAFLTQLGIVGLVSFIIILILSLVRVVIPAFEPESRRRTERKPGNNLKAFSGSRIFGRLWRPSSGMTTKDSLTLWACVYITYIVIHGLIDTPYFKNDLAILFWLAIAAIWTGKEAEKPSKKYVTLGKTGEK